MTRRALGAAVVAVLIWTALGLTATIHDRAQADRIDRAREAIEAEREAALAAIRETEGAELERLGLGR